MNTFVSKFLSLCLSGFLLAGLIPITIAIAQDQEAELFTYSLSQSTNDLKLWTTPPSERVFKDSNLPSESKDYIQIYAAKNEFEPFQVIVNPAQSQSVKVEIGDFGVGIEAELSQVKYVNIKQKTDSLGREGDYPDPLWPIENGAQGGLVANENTSFWVTLKVDPEAQAGDYETQVKIGDLSVPVKLHVFDFAIPKELHVKSQMNFSYQSILQKYGVSGTEEEYWKYVNMIHQFFMDHRLTPKGALWSGGLTNGGEPYIDYDCAGNFTDNDGIWGFEIPAKNFIDGDGFENKTGIPSFMAMTFKNNDAAADQRPGEFCGVNRSSSDWVGASSSTAFNSKWFEYIAGIESYLTSLGYLDEAYYYMANEPQNQEAYDAVAWYTQELKKAAPNLKLMVSEEPKPEIYDHPDYPGAKIDIWLPVLNNYDPEISWERERNHGEETWVYFLHGTRPPYFNPITLDHPGIESKLTGWFLWKYRLKGIAYYSLNSWSKNPWIDPIQDGHNGDLFMLYPPSETNSVIAYGSNNHRLVSSIRLELMRDSLEDYEYLYLLNNGANPKVDEVNSADEQAGKIVSGLTSYNRDSEFMYNLRKSIGQKNAGETESVASLNPEAPHARAEQNPANYYLNFQNPQAEPLMDPLVVDGKVYTKVGWEAYNDESGYGWYGNDDHVMYANSSEGDNDLQNSILYDDWGRQHTFEYALPNGVYNVTVGLGWAERTYDHNKINIEGIDFVNDEKTDPFLVRTQQVEIKDQKLTMEMSLFDEYTMLNYLDIEAVDFEPSKSGLTDISGHKNQEAIEYLVDQGIVDGYPDKTFKPNQEVNRAELLKIVIEGQGIEVEESKYANCFPDVTSEWFAKYVCYAKNRSWVKGYEDGTYKPAQTVNKPEAIKILLNSQEVPVDDLADLAASLPFSDVGSHDWFYPYILKAYQLGILEEDGAIYAPATGMLRGGIAENLFRLLE